MNLQVNRICGLPWLLILVFLILLPEFGLATFDGSTINFRGSKTTSIDEIPTSVTQILTAGSWSSEGKSGMYRVLVLDDQLTSEKQPSRVFVQWLVYDKNNIASEILTHREIREASEQKYFNAFVFVDAEENNAALLIISSYDKIREEDRQLWIKATSPGHYETVKPEEARGSDIGTFR